MLALLILIGLVLDQPMLTAIATIPMVVFLVLAIITFVRSRKPVTIALGTEAVHVQEDGHWTSYPLTLVMGVVEAEARVGPNTLHLDVPDGRLSFTKSGMETAAAVKPDDELAVAQVQFSDAGKGSVKLPAAESVMIDEKSAQYRPEIDTELTFGSGDQVMVWDFVFAVPKAATLQSVRFGAVSFDLGGVRDLDPGTRVTPGIHSRQSR